MKNTTTYIDNNLNCNNDIINLPENYQEISFSFSTILSNLHNNYLLSNIYNRSNDISLKEILEETSLISKLSSSHYNFKISENYSYYNKSEKINNLMFTVVLIKEILSSYNIKLKTMLNINKIEIITKLKLNDEKINNIMRNLEYILTRFRNAIIHNRVDYTHIDEDTISFYDEDCTERVHYRIEEISEFIEKFKIYILKLIDKKFNPSNETYDDLILEDYDASKYITEVTIEVYKLYKKRDTRNQKNIGKHYTQAYVDNMRNYKEIKINNIHNNDLKLTLESIDMLLLTNEIHCELFKIIDYYKEKNLLEVNLNEILSKLNLNFFKCKVFKQILSSSNNKILYWIINELKDNISQVYKVFNKDTFKNYIAQLYITNNKSNISSKIIKNSFASTTISSVLLETAYNLYKSCTSEVELYNKLNCSKEFTYIVQQTFLKINVCDFIFTEHRHEISMIYSIISLYELNKDKNNSFILLELIKKALSKENFVIKGNMCTLILNLNLKEYTKPYRIPISVTKESVNLITNQANNNIILLNIRNAMCHNNISYDYINKTFTFFDKHDNKIALFNNELFDRYIYEKIDELFIQMQLFYTDKK